jgi:hypothetical protein
VHPNPVVNLGEDIILSPGETCSLDAGNTGSSYLWSTGETSQTITVDTSGLFYVFVTNQFGCTGEDYINVSIAGHITYTGSQEIKIFPNPARSIVYIDPGKEKPEKIIIYNSTGQPVKSCIPVQGIIKMEVPGLPEGLYLVSVLTTNNHSVCSKLLIER